MLKSVDLSLSRKRFHLSSEIMSQEPETIQNLVFSTKYTFKFEPLSRKFKVMLA